MLPTNIFVDTEILLDNIIPERREQFKCSCLLIDEVSNGRLTAFTADYVLSEIMGILKTTKEIRKGTAHLLYETLTPTEKAAIQSIIVSLTNMPNLKIFTPIKPISQKDIYDLVRSICIQTKDALVLLTALEAKSKLKELELVTRDAKLMVRSKSQIASAHPSAYINKCPSDCLSKFSCRYRK